MLQPARRKYRKEQKGRNTGIATRGNTVAFGDFGLKSTDRGRLTARQIPCIYASRRFFTYQYFSMIHMCAPFFVCRTDAI